MATYAWRNTNNGAGGAFDVAVDWTNTTTGMDPASAAPSAGDIAVLAAGGGTLSGTGSVDTLSFSQLPTYWTVVGQFSATTITISAGSVFASVNGGQLIANGALNVIGGALTVANGGVVVVTAGTSGPVSSITSTTVSVANRGLLSYGGALNLGGAGTSAAATIATAVMTVGGVLKVGAAGGGAGSLLISAGGQVVLSGASDPTQPYLQIGAGNGVNGYVAVDGPTSLLLLANNSGTVGFGYGATGTLVVTGGASARLNASSTSSNNALNPALTIGRFGIGTVTISGANSSLSAGGSIIVGSSGLGTLRVQSGATANSIGFTSTQAALAVAAGGGSGGTVVIDGAGSTLSVTGAAVIGGDNRGSGLVGGGSGSVSIVNGGSLQTGTMTLLAGSQLAVDGASVAGISGNLFTTGTVFSGGTLVVSGAVYGGGLLQLSGGITDLGQLGIAGTTEASVSFSGSAALRVRALVGANTVTAVNFGDVIDFVGNSSVRLTGNLVTTTTGTLSLAPPPAGSQYELASDGAGGTFVALSTDTIGVYRFFDSNYGTHFFSASVSEKDTIVSTRPDLVYEGVGLQSVDPASADPNAAPVYRFFDLTYGTHFFTASASERDTVIATRPDLVYENTGFIEHTAQQAGDTAVYRFFDTRYGTHFYTADANERATIVATRPDLVDEGIGFYAPTG